MKKSIDLCAAPRVYAQNDCSITLQVESMLTVSELSKVAQATPDAIRHKKSKVYMPGQGAWFHLERYSNYFRPQQHGTITLSTGTRHHSTTHQWEQGQAGRVKQAAEAYGRGIGKMEIDAGR